MERKEIDIYDKNNDKILILIAAYCDDELLNTVRSALIQADNPNRIYFSICYQSDNLKDYEELKKIKNCRIKYLKASEAKGTCFARNICKQMIEDEKFIFQIDSHMRFVKHYDSKLIEQLVSLNDPKASISFYPPDCTEEMMKLPLDDKVFNEPGPGIIMRAKDFRNDLYPFIKIEGIQLNKNDMEFKKNPLISAGNYFAFADIYKSVLEDPNMFFYGDELPMAIRYYTHGLNNYSGKESYIYHKYVKEMREFPQFNDAFINEQNRFLKLLKLNYLNEEMDDIGQFGLGEERTLKDFENFSGIDFKNKKIYMSAELGNFENEKIRNKLSYLKERDYSLYKKQLEQSKIEVIIVDLFEEYIECIESCLKNAQNKNNIQFIVGTSSTNESYKNYKQIKKIVNYSKDDSYSKILSNLSNYLEDSYVAVVDSSFRFLNGWDKYLCDTIKTCGENTALTSWIWLTDDQTKAEGLEPYINCIKDFKCFYDYLPNLKYNYTIKLEKKKKPYQTPFISDGFLFCNSEILRTITIDPNLTYEEQLMIYSLRLWTNGIDIFYPYISYIYKTKSEKIFNTGEHHYPVICALLGMNNYYSKYLESGYQYDIGKKRTLWSWYDFMSFDYSNDSTFEF